jgi:beta-phosphoglucomutase family hydrolase
MPTVTQAVTPAGSRFGLPPGIEAGLFDLDGVLTKTAELHAAAWKQMLDAFLQARAAQLGGDFVPFDRIADYAKYVDGKPRYDGVRSFLESREIVLPEGLPTDSPRVETIAGLANQKNELVLELLRRKGVEPFAGSVRYVQALLAAGLHCGVVSSSANCRDVLLAAGIADLFEVRMDALVAQGQHLRGKPAPDTYLAASEALGVPPARAAVFEDALAGVSAAKAGGFGFVVGVDRVGQGDALREHGADVIVRDLVDLLE